MRGDLLIDPVDMRDLVLFGIVDLHGMANSSKHSDYRINPSRGWDVIFLGLGWLVW
jgi:hypothetical protein